ncbi:hypothetical protein N9O41_01895 [Crocinitomicaceae bacterium]|nr:hypothetical protein [Crocinitomicaceae bacterium]
MKKIFLSLAVVGILMSSCTDNGRKVEANEAQAIEVVKSEATIELTSVGNGSHVDWRASHLGGAAPRFGKISLKSATVLVNNGELHKFYLNLVDGQLRRDSVLVKLIQEEIK